MKATEEMSELRAAIEAAGASPALTHCSVLAGELAARLAAMETALEIIAQYGGTDTETGLRCTGSWCGEQARRALDVPEYPKPRSFGRTS